MKIIILFLLAIGAPLYNCFHFLHIPIQKTRITYYCIDPKIQDNEEKKNSGDETQTPKSRILNTVPDKRNLTYKYQYKGSGNDERYTTNNMDEKINYHKQIEKLVKFNYQMNLLKMLESNKHIDVCKLKAIDEYNFLYEKSKYLSNIESGGLYNSWEDNDL